MRRHLKLARKELNRVKHLGRMFDVVFAQLLSAQTLDDELAKAVVLRQRLVSEEIVRCAGELQVTDVRECPKFWRYLQELNDLLVESNVTPLR